MRIDDTMTIREANEADVGTLATLLRESFRLSRHELPNGLDLVLSFGKAPDQLGEFPETGVRELVDDLGLHNASLRRLLPKIIGQ